MNRKEPSLNPVRKALMRIYRVKLIVQVESARGDLRETR